MSSVKEFRLPDLGEGLTEGEILKWLVGVGDTVTLNQPIVEVETAKAAVEIPAKWAGQVTAIFHAEGETVAVGSPIISIDTDPGGSAPGPEPAEPAEGLIGGPAPGGRTAVLVGYGPRSTQAKRRPRVSTAQRGDEPAARGPAPAVETAAPVQVAGAPVPATAPGRGTAVGIGAAMGAAARSEER